MSFRTRNSIMAQELMATEMVSFQIQRVGGEIGGIIVIGYTLQKPFNSQIAVIIDH